MATTVNSDLIIHNETAQTAFLERMQDNLDVFNAASNNAIIVRDENLEGDFTEETLYKVGGAIEHRDVNSTAGITAKKIGAGEIVGVKVPFKYGPYETTEEAFKRRGRNVDEFSFVVGQDYADAVMAGYWEYATAAITGAIGTNAAMQVAGKFSVDGKKVLTKAMRTFGDKMSRLSLWVMDSASYLDIVDDAITKEIYEEAGTVIYGGLPGTMGKPVLVTDKAPANTIFGLQPGAVEIINSQLPGFRSYNVDDQENLAVGFRAEGAFNLNVLGYSYNQTAGGANPNLATLGAAANWTQYATSNKNTAGVIVDITETP